jgi:hypothetical protein
MIGSGEGGQLAGVNTTNKVVQPTGAAFCLPMIDCLFNDRDCGAGNSEPPSAVRPGLKDRQERTLE